MTARVSASPALRENPPRSRRRGEKRAAWRAPLRRAWRALDASLRRVDATRRVVEASERCGARRPIEVTRQLQRAGNWLSTAAALLSRSVRDADRSCSCAVLEPQRAAAVRPLLFVTAVRWLDAAGRLDAASMALESAMAGLVEQVRTWTVWPEDRRAAPARAASRPIHHATLVLIRRQWFVAAVAADAARRISRGRAPPSI